MKKFFLLTVLIMIYVDSGYSQSMQLKPVPVTAQVLKIITPSKSYFRGVVTPLKTGTFGTRNPGILEYTASPGDIVYSQVINDKGEVVRPGTPIIIQDRTLPELAVKSAEVALEKASRIIQNEKKEYERLYNLNKIKHNLIAEKQIDAAKTEYDSALLTLKKSEVELLKAKFNLKQCVVYPEFTGQVEEVYYAPGTSLDHFKDIIKVTMMNPMAIKFNFPVELINHIGIENTIKVYDADSSESKMTLLCKNPTDPSSFYLLVMNELVSLNKLTTEQKNLPVIHKIQIVINAYIGSQIMAPNQKFKEIVPAAVPVNAIQHDEKGTYVWKALDQAVLNKDRSVDTQFRLKKVYVNLGNILRHITFIEGVGNNYRSIENNSEINVSDILVIDSPAGLNDGDQVVYQQLHWRYTTNEAVKIVIDKTYEPGIYVPFNAIFGTKLGIPQVCIIENNKAVFVPIKQTGYHDEYVKIEGDGIKEGGLIVLNNDNALQKVYDMGPVRILKTVEAPEKLNYNVALPYNPVTEPNNENIYVSQKIK